MDRQKWYKEVSGKLMPYQGHIKMKSGRYYLMWCNPILAADTVPGNVIDTGLAASANITDSAQAPAKE